MTKGYSKLYKIIEKNEIQLKSHKKDCKGTQNYKIGQKRIEINNYRIKTEINIL